jgi:hypothetical protein
MLTPLRPIDSRRTITAAPHQHPGGAPKTTSDKADWREPMKTLAPAVATASLGLLAVDVGVAHAGGPNYFGIPAQWWILDGRDQAQRRHSVGSSAH